MRSIGAIAMLLVAAMPIAARAATPFERAVLDALNTARADPGGYARGLRDYAGFYRGRFVHLPGDPVLALTREGVAPVRETIAFLAALPARPPIRASGLLAATAADHVRVQSASGAVGHGRRGRGPADRLRAHGGGGQLAEVIAYGARDPADVVRQLLIDDGVPDRGHRRILVDPGLRFAGVACGPHRVYRTMCVIDLSQSWAGGGIADAELWARARAAAFARALGILPAR